jgi:hypothetical protein
MDLPENRKFLLKTRDLQQNSDNDQTETESDDSIDEEDPSAADEDALSFVTLLKKV